MTDNAENDVDFRASLVDGTWTVRSLVKTLAARRKALGLRQADVADALGFGQQYVSYWERGDGEPSLRQLQAYARLVGLEVRIDLCIIPPAEKCGVCGATRDEPEKCGYPGGCPIPPDEQMGGVGHGEDTLMIFHGDPADDIPPGGDPA